MYLHWILRDAQINDWNLREPRGYHKFRFWGWSGLKRFWSSRFVISHILVSSFVPTILNIVFVPTAMLSSAELKIRNGNDTVLSAEDVTSGKKQLEQGGSVTLQEGAPLERSLRLQHKVLGNTCIAWIFFVSIQCCHNFGTRHDWLVLTVLVKDRLVWINLDSS